MKSKTIAAILKKKFTDFANSIDDPATKLLVEQNTIITGGCIVSLLMGDKVNDYDCYFKTQECALAVANYYCKKFQETEGGKGYDISARVMESGRVTISVFKSKNVSVAGDADAVKHGEEESAEEDVDLNNVPPADDGTDVIERADEINAEDLEKPEDQRIKKYTPLFLSSNAITLSAKVQLIIRFFGPPDEIHANYDFVHCTSYWCSWNEELVLRKEALESIITKELRYVGSRYPICSIIRTRKFLGRGWTINAGQYVKMAWQVSELDLTNIEVLKDQLVGVDSAYFNHLISCLKAKSEKEKVNDNPLPIDGSYLMTLIDKIF